MQHIKDNYNIFIQLLVNIETFSALCANFHDIIKIWSSVGVKKQGEGILDIFETFWQQFTHENILY